MIRLVYYKHGIKPFYLMKVSVSGYDNSTSCAQFCVE